MYFDLFYISSNIVGYTGSLTNNPTVYFRNGNTFGRITQAHNNTGNIGRNTVRTKADYSLTNTGPNNQAQEFYDGKVRHTSRNKFVEVTSFSRFILERAIKRFPNKKTGQ